MKATIDNQRVTCEHCGSDDCAGIAWPRGGKPDPEMAQVVCCLTGKAIHGLLHREPDGQRMEGGRIVPTDR